MYNLVWPIAIVAWCVCFKTTTADGPCFEFPGNSYVHFTPNNFDNNDTIHYRLEFSTTQSDGIIMYSRGPQGYDDEALFIRDGYLNYHLFNTAPSGVENEFGGYFRIDQLVNTGEWITAHVYRSWRIDDSRRQRHFYQTGIVANINGLAYTNLDRFHRTGINLTSTIYFGGYKESLSSTLSRFQGKIRNMSEEKNRQVFDTPSLNYESKVKSPCQ